ncbi:MAG: MFS transporter [Candidatus Thorarchaeota archaeon]|nr:MAG: MFS transporter [Candidatus Thorarchaeota archaeon]
MSKVTNASYAVLIACVLAHFMNHVYHGILSPFLPVITDELSLSYTEAGIVTSAAIVTMTMAHLGVGYLSDKGWGDIFIPASILLSAAIVLFASLATTFLFLVMCMALLGMGASGYHPSAFPALTVKFPRRSRAKATGMQAAGGLVGMALIPLLGVVLLDILGGWRESMFALGAAGIFVFVPTALLMRYARKEDGFVEATVPIREGPEGWTRDFKLALGVMGLRGIPFRCTTLLMPLYLVASYGYEPLWAGSLTTLMLVAGLVGQAVSAPLSDRTGRRVPYIVISTAVVAPSLLLLNFALDPVFLILVLITIGFFFFFGVPATTAYLTEVTPAESKGLAFGILFSFGAIPGALSPAIFGIIGDSFGLPASILFLVLMAFFASLIATLMKDNEDYEPKIPVAATLISE